MNKHYRCLLGAINCLDDEVPLFTRGAVILCVTMPYIMVALYFGLNAFGMVLAITLLSVFPLSFIVVLIEDGFFDFTYEQCVKLPKALKKCTQCKAVQDE